MQERQETQVRSLHWEGSPQREWRTTPVFFLAWESSGQSNLVRCSPWDPRIRQD